MNAHALISAILDCSHHDTDYLLRFIDAYDLDPRDLMDDVNALRA